MFKEVTSTETFDGDAAWLDDHGVIYAKGGFSSSLDILLPDLTRVTIPVFEDGMFGIHLDAAADFFAGGEVTLAQNGWTDLPRSPSASVAGLFGTGDLAFGQTTHDNLPAAYDAYATLGPDRPPALPQFG